MKRRLAIWLPGGVGGGYYSQGQPALMQVIHHLAKEFQITVFSFHPANDDFVAEDFHLITGAKFPRKLRWFLLMVKFFRLHLQNSYSKLYAFWGFPSGLIVVVLGKVFRVPSIIHFQGGEVACIPEIGYGILCNPFYERLSLWSYRKADQVIVLTNFQKKLLLHTGVNRPIHIIPFGPDLTRFPFKGFTYKETRELRCLHIANITPVKDQLTLLKAFALISERIDAQLHIVGLDTMNGYLNQLCLQFGIQDRVKFFPPQPHNVMSEFYNWADIFILTSLYEGQGVVWVEAAASGVLLTGTSVGLLDDLGKDYAITVQPKDYEGLSQQILEIIRDKAKIRNMINRSFDWVRHHRLEWAIGRIIQVINQR